MLKNTKKIQTKKSTRNIPINPKSTRTTRNLGLSNKKIQINNDPFSFHQQKVPFTIENNIRLNNNKFPPKAERNPTPEKSADRIRYKSSKIQIKKKESDKQIEFKNKNYVITNQNNLSQEMCELKSGIGEIKEGIGRIETGIGELKEEVKTKTTKVDSSLNDIKNILIKGFEALFALLQNNMNQFEEKKNFKRA